MTVSERSALGATARLLGRLLLCELDDSARAELLVPEVRAGLESLGLELAPLESANALDELAGEFFETMVRPEHGPLVQSLWTAGTYEGDAAVAVRRIAKALNVELDADFTRGASHDHLGALLALWAEANEVDPELADAIASQHLAWARKPLARLAEGSGFYAQLASVTSELIASLTPE